MDFELNKYMAGVNMKRILIICFLLQLNLSAFCIGIREIKSGWLLFAVNKEGNAITESTILGEGLRIDHVGIAMIDNDKVMVYEAKPSKGVTVTPIEDFLKYNRQKGGCVVAAKVKHRPRLSVLRRNLQRYIGLPYDSIFGADDKAIYCSEFVQKVYIRHHRHIFPSIPMSFHDKTGKILPYWIRFYERLGMEVPEGEPGTNPGQLSRDKNVEILGIVE